MKKTDSVWSSLVKRMKFFILVFAGLVIALSLFENAYSAPRTFDQAKVELKRFVYFDRNQVGGEMYCGCNWEWVGRSGGRIDKNSCGYVTRAQENRAARIEYEHVLPASSGSHHFECWREGGRQNCQRTDPAFQRYEADMHNLTISVGEVNADRSNYRFGVLPGAGYQHGQCDFKVDFNSRVAEPRDEVKGKVARIYFYMSDRYDIRLSEQQQRLFMSWDRQFPPTVVVK